MRTPNAFKEYAEMRLRNPQNKGKSFTYGCILYDYIKNGGNFAELGYGIEQQALEIVQTQLDAKRDAVYNLSDLALAEIFRYKHIGRTRNASIGLSGVRLLTKPDA